MFGHAEVAHTAGRFGREDEAVACFIKDNVRRAHEAVPAGTTTIAEDEGAEGGTAEIAQPSLCEKRRNASEIHAFGRCLGLGGTRQSELGRR